MSTALSPLTAVDQVRLGDLNAGPIATGETGGVIRLHGDASTTWGFWVGAEDRWYRPDAELTATTEHLGGAAGVRTTVRIPSGAFVGSISGARLDALGGPAVLVELLNDSPVPVAVAFVVTTSKSATLRSDGLDIEGLGSLRLTRPAAGVVSAPDADALLAALEAGESSSVAEGNTMTGAIALLIPLPHAAHAIAAVAVATEDGAPVGTFDRATAPRIEAITRGWAAHLGSSPSMSSGVARRDAVRANAAADVLMGPSWGADGALEVGAVAEALGRLGRIDLSEPLEVLLSEQRSNGSFADDDVVAATAQAMRALGAAWSAGATDEAGIRFLEAAAIAAHFLDKRRNRAAVAVDSANVSFAYESVIGMAEDLGETEIAERFRNRCLELGVGTPLTGVRADESVAALGAGLSFGFADRAAVGQNARFVIRSTAEIVADRADAVDIYPGYAASLAGNELDVEAVPTRWGILSFSLRWHGRRPAILWELTPWSQRTPARPFALTCSSIDPTWRATDAVGEGLLAEPAEADFEAPPEFVPEHLLSESSDGHSHGDWNAVPDFGGTSDIPDSGTFS